MTERKTVTVPRKILDHVLDELQKIKEELRKMSED